MAIFNTISPEWLHPQERDGQQARQYARIVGITHNKQEIQRSATNTNIRVLQGNEDCGLGVSDRFCTSFQLRQLGHRQQTKVSNVSSRTEMNFPATMVPSRSWAGPEDPQQTIRLTDSKSTAWSALTC
jgi:hypothetical protein